MIPSPFYVVFLVFVGIFLLVFAYGLFTTASKRTGAGKKRLLKGFIGEAGVCPLCRTLLSSGEQIKSAVYPGKDDKICHIFGCPHCHPFIEDNLSRICPVCKKPVPPEEYLVARLFERPNNKRHVHILGCTGCRIPRKK